MFGYYFGMCLFFFPSADLGVPKKSFFRGDVGRRGVWWGLEGGLTSSSLTVACPNVLAAFLARPRGVAAPFLLGWMRDTHTAHPGRGLRLRRSKHCRVTVMKR